MEVSPYRSLTHDLGCSLGYPLTSTRQRLYCWTTKEVSGYLYHGRKKVIECLWEHEPWNRGIIMIDLIVSRCSTHGLLLCFILLHISNGSVSTSLVGHVLYSADLMSATCTPHSYLIVHRYIYSRYSSVFLTLYQLYLFFSFLTLISFSRLYLVLQPELLLKVVTVSVSWYLVLSTWNFFSISFLLHTICLCIYWAWILLVCSPLFLFLHIHILLFLTSLRFFWTSCLLCDDCVWVSIWSLLFWMKFFCFLVQSICLYLLFCFLFFSCVVTVPHDIWSQWPCERTSSPLVILPISYYLY